MRRQPRSAGALRRPPRPPHPGRRWLAAPGRAALLALAFAALLLDAASLPHLHVGDEVGYYNQEHDLRYLATLGGGTLPPDPESGDRPAPAVGTAPPASAPHLASAPAPHADSRAPPGIAR